MNNFLVAVAVLVIAAFGALFAVPQFVDWNRYRGVFEEEASRFLGRDVRVGGSVGLSLLPTPSFRLERIVVADSEAGSGEAFFRADALSARLSIAPLLRGVLEANEIEIASPQLHIVPGRKAPAGASPFSRMSDRLPFAPRDLAFASVRFKDGVLVVAGADRNERFRITGVEGELSAPALRGPYRIRATYGDANARRDIRISTTEADSDGSVRYKLAVKELDTGATYNLDARASDLSGAMRSDGEFTAEIPLSAPNPAAAKAKSVASERSQDAPFVELKAAMTADTEQLKLANLTATIEQQGRPQVLTGEAAYQIGPGQLRVALESRWLDLDKLTAMVVPATAAKSPLVDLLATIARANVIGNRGASTLALKVDQATLGQESVTGLAVQLSSARGVTEIDAFRLGMPGGSRAEFNGRSTGAAAAVRYDGDLTVRGTSLARLLSWATGGGFKLDPARDAPFSIRAKVDASADNIKATHVVAELAGTIGQGEVEVGLKDRRTLSVTVEGEQVDLRPFFPVATESAGQRRNPIVAALAAAAGAGLQIENVDSRLRLRAGRVLTPDGVYNDATADLEWRDRNLRIGQLKFDAGDGVMLDIEGQLADPSGSPRGTLRGVLSAESGRGVATLAGLAAWPANLAPGEQLATAIAPLHIAGTAVIADNGALDLTADGRAANANVKVRSRFDRGLAAWKTSGLDLSVLLDGPDAERIARALAGQPPSTTSATTSTRLVLRASGQLAEGLISHASLERAGAQASFSGRVSALDPLKASGDLKWMAPDGAVLQSLLGELPRLRLDGVAARGTGRLEYTRANLALKRIEASIGDSPVTGAVSLVRAGERDKITGDLRVGTLTLAGLVRPWTEPPVRTANAVVADANALSSAASRMVLGGAWPSLPFDIGGSKTDGAVTLQAANFEIIPGMALQEASMRVVWQAPKLEVSDIKGRAAGGNWTGALTLDGAGAASRLTGAVRANRLRLEQALADGSARASATGAIDLTLSGTGKGASLRDIVADLSGSGTLEIIAGSFGALSPAAVHVALETAMTSQADGMIPRLKEQLETAMRKPAVPTELRPAKLPIEIAGGVASTKPLIVDTAQGRAVGSAKVDLPAAMIAAEWRIERLAPLLSETVRKTPPPPLPPVVAVVTGPLGSLGKLPATLNLEALEREITVRKMERDVEELERLRKLDEDRAKEEAGRNSLPLTPLSGAPAAPDTPLPPAVDVTATVGQTPPLAAPVPAPPEPVRVRPAPPPQQKPAFRPFDADGTNRSFGGG